MYVFLNTVLSSLSPSDTDLAGMAHLLEAWNKLGRLLQTLEQVFGCDVDIGEYEKE